MKFENYIIAHYTYDEEHKYRNRLSCYTYGNEVQYGSEQHAEKFLEYVKSQRPDYDWQIIWIDVERSNIETREEILERLKKEWEEEREEVEKWRPWG